MMDTPLLKATAIAHRVSLDTLAFTRRLFLFLFISFLFLFLFFSFLFLFFFFITIFLFIVFFIFFFLFFFIIICWVSGLATVVRNDCRVGNDRDGNLA